MPTPSQTFVLEVRDQPWTLVRVAEVFSRHGANILSIGSHEGQEGRASLSVEIDVTGEVDALLDSLSELDVVLAVHASPSFSTVYGKRVIVIGGGAQVGQVAMGAITEADRHNIRGERISVDTIPLVGEVQLAEAVRAVALLPRARVLVLAGALMGGAITEAVREVREHGILVISLNMVGSVRAAADLVVTDPLQAGVMAVMAIADTASFDIARQQGRTY
jgi:energy-converting hydrogenase B subunit Q